jgi:hypothetical protein
MALADLTEPLPSRTRQPDLSLSRGDPALTSKIHAPVDSASGFHGIYSSGELPADSS